ncbi:MAG: cellulase N-terminal Ig-like domain-containing protein [Lachnospiraceae bacterium]
MQKIFRLQNKIAGVLVCIFLISAVFSGCGQKEEPVAVINREPIESLVSMEEAPVLEYEVPVFLPGVLVDRIGYEAAGDKLIIVRGNHLPKEFSVIDALTGTTVFTGELEEQMYDGENGEYNSYGDFSSFTTEGTYYIVCDVVGQSYSFVIEEAFYENRMAEALTELAAVGKNLESGEILKVCEGVSVLLLSYELFGDVYDNAAAGGTQPQLISLIKEYIIWLLAQQDSQTGAVVQNGQIDKELTAWFSAVLAKFSYTYQKFDSTYATVCLQAADRAWDCLQKQEDVPAETMFYAAAELYRATGQYAYHREVKNLGSGVTLETDCKAQVLGALTYALTKRKVDVEICSDMLQALFTEAEEIAVRANENVYMTGSTLQEGEEKILWDMILVSAIDYVITNNEYATMIEEHLHYLAGENETAECLVTWSENGTGDRAEENSVVRLAGYVMMLSEILSHRQEN